MKPTHVRALPGAEYVDFTPGRVYPVLRWGADGRPIARADAGHGTSMQDSEWEPAPAPDPAET